MKATVSVLAFAAVLLLLVGCGPKAVDQSERTSKQTEAAPSSQSAAPKQALRVPYKLSLAAYRTAQPGPDIQWQLPPGGHLSVLYGGRYYMDLVVDNQSVTAIASPGMNAYIVGPSGAVLRILVLDPKDGPIEPGTKRDYILDVAGYTDALLRGRSTSPPATIYVYVAEVLCSGLLPKQSELMDKKPVNISLQNTTDIPDVEEVAPLRVGSGEWGVLGTDGPPQVARIQGRQASFYFYYEHAPIVNVANVHQGSSIGEEMAKVGVGSDFRAVVVEEKPWPKP